MNLLMFSSFEIFTNGSKESKLIDFPKFGFNSKLGSLEIQAKWITIS